MGTLYHLNVGCADASVITTDGGTYLIDCQDIGDYKHLLPSSKTLSGVFITHQHEDHYSGLGYLKSHGYQIRHLIYSPYRRRNNDQSVTIDEWREFNHYREYFESRGTKTHSPFRQGSLKDPWWKPNGPNGIKFWIVGPDEHIATKPTRELHDACLVILAKGSYNRCLFTGDASDQNLNYIARKTQNYCNGILHASHHGSINGADAEFVKGCNATNTVVSTKSGVYSNVPHRVVMERYRNNTREKVYRTDHSGDLKWEF